jgi:hypothetical protein
MPAKPIDLGPMHFAKRGDAVAYLNAMLRYDLGDKVSAAMQSFFAPPSTGIQMPV